MTMQLIYLRGRFEFKTTFHGRHLPKDADFSWDRKTKRWVTTDPRKANRLRCYATDRVKAILDEKLNELDAALLKRHQGSLVY